MNYRESLKDSIAELVYDFQLNPFDYLYEADLQAALFAKAYARFQSARLPMRGGYHPADRYPEAGVIRTIPVKCEYPGQQRFDLAVIDPARMEVYDQARGQAQGWKNDRFWNQPVCAAVEIKYLQLGDSPTQRVTGFRADIRKLRGYPEANAKFCGIALLFVQSDAQFKESFGDGLVRLADMTAVGSGIHSAIVGPSRVEWYRAV